jgi:putative acetyltransferase
MGGEAVSVPPATLRPFLPSDTPALASIFRDSIEVLAMDDYDDAQVAAWIAMADDLGAFGKRLAANLTLVACITRAPAAFASLKGAGTIDMLYVDPSVARQGIGDQLCDALERIAAARGAKKLTGDISDTALPLFEKRGYSAERRNTVPLSDTWIGNTTMTKQLGAKT